MQGITRTFAGRYNKISKTTVYNLSNSKHGWIFSTKIDLLGFSPYFAPLEVGKS